ncbi:MAG: GDSL-type esterase/lipase family protein, partial [Victivallaceae bacterium]
GRWETLTPPAVKIIAGNNSSVSELKLEFDGSMTGIAQLPLTILPQQRSKDGSVRGQVDFEITSCDGQGAFGIGIKSIHSMAINQRWGFNGKGGKTEPGKYSFSFEFTPMWEDLLAEKALTQPGLLDNSALAVTFYQKPLNLTIKNITIKFLSPEQYKPASTIAPLELDKMTNAAGYMGKWWLRRHQQLKNAYLAAKGRRIIFGGDSITQGWDKAIWNDKLQVQGIFNFGINGDRTENLLARLRDTDLAKNPPSGVILLIGTNNIAMQSSINDVIAGVECVIDYVQTAAPQCKILLIPILPRALVFQTQNFQQVELINQGLERLAAAKKIGVLNLTSTFSTFDSVTRSNVLKPEMYSPDMLHLSKAGYQAYAEKLLPALDLLYSPRGGELVPKIAAQVEKSAPAQQYAEVNNLVLIQKFYHLGVAKVNAKKSGRTKIDDKLCLTGIGAGIIDLNKPIISRMASSMAPLDEMSVARLKNLSREWSDYLYARSYCAIVNQVLEDELSANVHLENAFIFDLGIKCYEKWQLNPPQFPEELLRQAAAEGLPSRVAQAYQEYLEYENSKK